ncbi:SMI1/KNR4 family protein [Streptomyces sp. NPDC056982]|uniref:SMI1/KNR4 family protein n=1 Tax=Streptomyces sp. NPDC056982 TaxID=3345986 RepID=UPI0036406FE6
MMAGMNTERCDPVELAALREIFASRPEAAPPAGWEAVRSFEAEHGIVLPEPYRTFVAEIRDGLRAGPPYYGLLPLAQTPPDWGSDHPERLLAKPFPLTEAWLWEAEGDEEALPQQEFEARTDPVFDHGSLLLGTDGCGMYWHLIVTGPQRGHVWQIAGEGAMPFGTQSANALMPGVPGFTGWATKWAQGRDWFADTKGDGPKETA